MTFRFIVVLAVAGCLFAAAFGSAASLGSVTSSVLGAGDAAVVSCDTDGMRVDFLTKVQDTYLPPRAMSGIEEHGVLVTQVATSCSNKYMLLEFVGRNSQELASVVSSPIIGGFAYADRDVPQASQWSGATTLWAEDVYGLRVAIKDAPF